MAPLNHFQVVTPRGTQMPSERSGHRIFADDNYVYLIGGGSPEQRTLSDAWRFNRLTQSWQQCTMADAAFPLPDTLTFFSLVTRGPGPDFNSGSNEAYIFGGIKLPFSCQHSNSNSLHWVRIDRSGRVHLKLQSVQGEEPLPARHHPSMCRRLEMNQGRLQEVIYIVGGTTGHGRALNDVWKLQRPAGANLDQSWDATRLNHGIFDDEFGRYCLELVAHGHKLYTFGGCNSRRHFVRLDELTIFDLNSNQFERLPTKADPEHGFPRRRACHALVHRRNMVYLLGGTDGETIFATVWRLDLDSLEWTRLRTYLPVPVYANSAAISPDGCIFVFGGLTRRSRQPNEEYCSHLQRMWAASALARPHRRWPTAEGPVRKAAERAAHRGGCSPCRCSGNFFPPILGPQDEEENNNTAAAAPPPTHTLAAAPPRQATAEQKQKPPPSLFSTFLDWICCRPPRPRR